MYKQNKTEAWRLYEMGQEWNRNLETPYYDYVTTNWEMYKGNQWVNAKGLKDFPKPVFNIIKRTITFFVASMTSTKMEVEFEPPAKTGKPEIDEKYTKAISFINSAFNNFWEKQQLDSVIRELATEAAVSGDMGVHMYFNEYASPYGELSGEIGDIELETIDGVNMYFGNPNCREVEKQPYILIYGRDPINELEKEIRIRQKLENINVDKLDDIEVQSDNDFEEQASLAGQNEIKGNTKYSKAGYIIKMCKLVAEGADKETVHVTKQLKNNTIYKNVDTGLTRYPVAFNNWEKQKNNYHGLSVCGEIVPNQIFINRMFAMAMFNLMKTAFPKAIINGDLIENWTNRIDGVIKVKGVSPNTNIANAATYLNAGEMSNQIPNLIEQTMAFTKDMLGANDALLGNINPEQASGTSISITARQSGIPLENPKNNIRQLLEDIARNFIDMVTNYYGERPITMETEIDGEKQNILETFDFDELKEMSFNVKVNVGATTYWDQNAINQRLDGLLQSEKITFVDWLKRVPDEYIPMKQDLIDELQAQVTPTQQNIMQQQPMQQQGINNPLGLR